MELDTQTLKESRLGPIVLFYTKTKRVTPSINRQADALVQAWSRPIIKRPANLRSRHVDTVNDAAQERQAQRARDREEGEDDVDMEDAPRPAQAMKRQRFDARAALKETVGRKGARIFINRVNSSSPNSGILADISGHAIYRCSGAFAAAQVRGSQPRVEVANGQQEVQQVCKADEGTIRSPGGSNQSRATGCREVKRKRGMRPVRQVLYARDTLTAHHYCCMHTFMFLCLAGAAGFGETCMMDPPGERYSRSNGLLPVIARRHLRELTTSTPRRPPRPPPSHFHSTIICTRPLLWADLSLGPQEPLLLFNSPARFDGRSFPPGLSCRRSLKFLEWKSTTRKRNGSSWRRSNGKIKRVKR